MKAHNIAKHLNANAEYQVPVLKLDISGLLVRYQRLGPILAALARLDGSKNLRATAGKLSFICISKSGKLGCKPMAIDTV